MKFLTIRTRLMIYLLIVSLLACAVLSVVGSRFGQASIRSEVESQLNLVRSAKKSQIESYFNNISHLVEVLGQNTMTIDAAKEFRTAYRGLYDSNLNKECSSQLSSHYHSFLDRLMENMDVKPDVDMYIPQTVEACYLQYEYLIDNPNPLGEKDEMVDAKDNSPYNQVHVRYHEYFRTLIRKFDFYDMFIVDLERGDIIYSVFKETDFATSLFTGPYRESNLAQLARKLKNNTDIETARWIDFAAYRPSYGAPAGFVGVPLSEGSDVVGALIFQLPVDQINSIMTNDGHWKEDGLGESGETYLLGEDYYMRSISRFFLEDTLGFRSALLDKGKTEKELDVMYRFGTTIMQQQVKSDAVKDALDNNTATRVVKDYRGVNVVSSYSPLQLQDLHWVILAEKDEAEAFEPVSKFNQRMFMVTVILVLLITLLAFWLSSRFVQPIEVLTSGARKIIGGDTSHRVSIESKDEFGELATSFNQMIGDLDQQKKLIHTQNEENEKLLLNFLPQEIANRVKNDEENIADTYQNVSLIAIDIVGFSQLTEEIGAQQSVQLLNEIISAIDDSAEKNAIEKIRTVGDTYFAACGLFNSRLDHAKRMVQFAKEAQQLIGQFNLNHRQDLKVHIAINSGSVAAGIVGKHHYNFDIWGIVVNDLFRMNELEIDDVILVTDEARSRLEQEYQFKVITDPHRPHLKIFALDTGVAKLSTDV